MVKISVIGICGMSQFMRVHHFHENGETLIADSICFEIGGKGINQAIAAKRMGAEVAFLTAVGDDEFGKESIKIIKENNLKDFSKIKNGEKTPVAVILTDRNGENRVTEFHTAVLSVEDVYSFEEEIKASDILLIQQEVPLKVNEAAIRLAQKYNVRVILNPAPAVKEKYKLEKKLFMVTPNEQESACLTDSIYENIITTLGKDGCLINNKIKIEPLNIKAVDTTGAGDTFNGVLAVMLAEGKSIEEAARYAVCASGISVGRENILNAIPTREETERRMKGE